MKEKELRVLVVYYSFEGNPKLIAEAIAEETDCRILKLDVEKPIVNISTKYVVGGKQVILKEKPKLMPYNFDAENYDLLFIGTPVWAWNYSPALRTFFSENMIQNKKIALFSCNGGDSGKTFENMKKVLRNNEFLSEIQFYEPITVNKQKNIDLARSWAEKVVLSME